MKQYSPIERLRAQQRNERVKRCRERKRNGKTVVQIELNKRDFELLSLLKQGLAEQKIKLLPPPPGLTAAEMYRLLATGCD